MITLLLSIIVALSFLLLLAVIFFVLPALGIPVVDFAITVVSMWQLRHGPRL